MNESDKKITNKISVYLLKEQSIELKDIIDEPDNIQSLRIDQKTSLYYSSSQPSLPSWTYKFFGQEVSNSLRSVLYTAYVSAVLLIDVYIEKDITRKFALTFGLGGWQLLRSGSYEERFGLMATLNLVSPQSIRSIDKSNMGLSPKQAREQIVAAGNISDFGIDIEQDLVRAVTGKCVNPDHGTTITGKDSLHISSKVDISNIEEKLKLYLQSSKADTYKTNYAWIDQVAEVKDVDLHSRLNAELTLKLDNNKYENIWLAVPEVIDWSDIAGFIYAGDTGSYREDLYIEELTYSLRSRGKDISLENIRSQRIVALRASDNKESQRWSAYSCIYAEIKLDHNLFTLTNGKWYKIEQNFVRKVNDEYDQILSQAITLPDYELSDGSENNYNIRIANELSLTLMDAKNIPYGGGQSKVEFCDVLDHKHARLYHIKKYGGSSVLSHLFNQGLVSAQLMLGDEGFRMKVNDLLPDAEKFVDARDKPAAQNYEIIFAVISRSNKSLNIPFFSKVSLNNVKRNLELYGINNISLIKILSKE